MGGISNITVLLNGTEEDVVRQARQAAEAGINVIGPECAVPLGVGLKNLKAIAKIKTAAKWRTGHL